MAFYLRIEKDGIDQYPRLFDAMKRAEVYDTNRVRFELMKRLGFFVTESSEHNAEYSPWFIPHGDAVRRRFDVPLDEYLHRCEGIIEQFERMRASSRCDDPIDVRRSAEYGSTIVHSVVTNRPSIVYGNMPNCGTIANLPPDAIAEAPTVVDRSGMRFTTVGELPPQLLAYMNPHVAQHELFVRAAMEGRRDHVYQACMFDPLTSATLPPDRIVEMCDELIAAHGFARDGGFLPDLDAKRTLVPASGKNFERVDVQSSRTSWEIRQKKCQRDFIQHWHVLGPFPSAMPSRVSLDQPTPLDESQTAIQLHGTFPVNGRVLTWRPASASAKGHVDLAAVLGHAEWCIGYAFCEFNSARSRQALLRCGSDDGIRIWINGQQVHSREVGRAYRAGNDEVAITLRQGPNSILVKVDNYQGAWGFGVSISPDFP
jgi:hypothetical protein